MNKVDYVYKTYEKLLKVKLITGGNNTKAIKMALGDSINNHRTLTVSQTVRYLNELVGLGYEAAVLQSLHDRFKEEILLGRNRRVDAVELRELLQFYDNMVMESGFYRDEVRNIVKRVT